MHIDTGRDVPIKRIDATIAHFAHPKLPNLQHTQFTDHKKLPLNLDTLIPSVDSDLTCTE